MGTTNSIAAENIFSKLQIKETILLLSLSVLLPFVIHLLPGYNGIPMGAILLAMFFAPLIAIKYFKFHVGLIVAALAPIANFLITGNPMLQLLPVITMQLILFVVCLKFFERAKSLNYINAVISFVVCVVISSMILAVYPSLLSTSSPLAFLKSSLINSLPGIVLLASAEFVIRKLKKN